MDTPIPGLPAEWQVLVPVLIGLLSSLLVAPLTAIAKKMGCTTGITTVSISAGLSALIAGIAGYATGLYGHGWAGVLAALGATVTAFLKANGDYLTRVNANRKAIDTSAPVSETVPAPESGLESIR